MSNQLVRTLALTKEQRAILDAMCAGAHVWHSDGFQKFCTRCGVEFNWEDRAGSCAGKTAESEPSDG